MLALLRPRGHISGGFELGGRSASFPAHAGMKSYAVTSGECWLVVDGVPEPVYLTAGACFLLPHGRAFCISTDLALAPIDAQQLREAHARGEHELRAGTQSCFVVATYFVFDDAQAGMLLGVLPPIVLLEKEADKAAMRWSLERMAKELSEPQPGGSLVTQHLAHMILIQALRLHLQEGTRGGVGWLFALADPQMRAAISAMHDEPARRWSLQELAARAGMSRSTFAVRFKETVGTSPVEYLTRWRMLVAGDRLTMSSDPISVIAPQLGYESESAFSTAFKRVMGCSPREYGQRPSVGA